MRAGDLLRGRGINGKYEKKGDHNGYPKYVKPAGKDEKGKAVPELAIWYSFMDEACHQGWVLGDPVKKTSSKNFFTDFAENGGYRIFLKYDGWEQDPTDCACQLGSQFFKVSAYDESKITSSFTCVAPRICFSIS